MNDISPPSPFVPGISRSSSAEDIALNQILYPNKFDNVLEQPTQERPKKMLFQIICITYFQSLIGI